MYSISSLVASSGSLAISLNLKEINGRPDLKKISLVALATFVHALASYSYWTNEEPGLESSITLYDPMLAVLLNVLAAGATAEFAFKVFDALLQSQPSDKIGLPSKLERSRASDDSQVSMKSSQPLGNCTPVQWGRGSQSI